MRSANRARRGRRWICLDIAHRHPDMLCPWCDSDPTRDPLLEAARRQHAATLAEDAEGSGWAA